MSNIENQIETLNALKRDVRAVINESKAEKNTIEVQRNELFTSLQGQVGELVNGARLQLQEVTSQLATQKQEFQQFSEDYQTKKNEYEQFKNGCEQSKADYEQTIEQQKQNLSSLQEEFNQFINNNTENLNARAGEYTEKITNFENELQNKKEESLEKSKELQEEFNTKKNEIDALSQKQKEEFEATQKQREEKYEELFLNLKVDCISKLSENGEEMNKLHEKYIESFDEILSEARNLVNQINEIMPGAATVKLARGFRKAKTRYGPDDDKVDS